MAGIAGIARRGVGKEVSEMLDIMNHRGKAGRSVFESGGVTLGIVWTEAENETVMAHLAHKRIADDNGPGHCARAEGDNGSLLLYRDELGVAPLYYGSDDQGSTCFASEVKALLPLTREVKEMPPGTSLDSAGFSPHFLLKAAEEVDDDPERIATKLRMYLEDAVAACIRSEDIGSWLSGGLDSSAICAMASGHVCKLKTFAAGITGAPDLEYAREVARHIGAEH
ncbi:MAG: asparagine synthase, partial [Bacteroidia bacterium]